jgi:hypothetical protein
MEVVDIMTKYIQELKPNNQVSWDEPGMQIWVSASFQEFYLMDVDGDIMTQFLWDGTDPQGLKKAHC